jgi:hypothetical protein
MAHGAAFPSNNDGTFGLADICHRLPGRPRDRAYDMPNLGQAVGL